MASQVEEFIARLNDQVSPGARAATNSLAQLEAQIVREQQAAMQLQQSLGQAFDKMNAVAMGNGKSVNVRQYRKAQEEVAGIAEKIGAAQQSIDRLSEARGLAGRVAAMEQARGKIQSVAAAMKELQSQQQLIEAGGGRQSSRYAEVSKLLEAHQGKLLEAQQQYVRMGGSAAEATAAAGGMTAATQAADVATGGLVGRFREFIAIGPAGMVAAVASAVVALTVALVGAVVAATKFAVRQADMARSNRLSNQALEMSYRHLKGVGDMVERVSGRMGIAQSEVRSIAQGFARTRLSATALEGALEKVATAKIAGASEFYLAQLRASLMRTGKVAPHLAAQFSHLEQIAATRMLELDKQGERLRRNFGKLFSGLKIEALLKQLSTLVAVFDQNTEAGKALKFLFEQMFQPLIGGATGVIPIIRRAMLYVVIYALRAYIAVKQFAKSGEGTKLIAFLGAVRDGLAVVGVVASVVGTALSVMIQAAATKALALAGALATIPALWGVIASGAASAWAQVEAAGKAALAWLRSVDLAGIGVRMMQGLANGIIKGGAAVAAAIKSVVGGAIASASAMLQERSPSRVFFRKGVNTALGMERGVLSRAGQVQRAIVQATVPSAVANDTAPAAGGKAAVPARARAQRGDVHFHNCTFFGTTREQVRELWLSIVHEDELAAAG